MSDREAPDVALLARTARGETEALGVVARRHAPSVLRLARAIVGDEAKAADVLQETFLAALRSADAYRPEIASVRTWLFAIARNLARKSLRGARVVQGAERELLELGIAAGWGSRDPEREVGGLRCRDVLARLSDYVDAELPANERTAVEIHLRGCSVCERFGGRFAATLRATREALGAAPTVDEALLARIRARMEEAA